MNFDNYQFLNNVLDKLDQFGFDREYLTPEQEERILLHMDEEYTIEESAREIFHYR